MLVKIIKQPKYPQSWYYDRVGQVFDVLEEKHDSDGKLIYIVQKSRVLNTYIDASDCEIIKDQEKEEAGVS
jgi:hypothetical protein